MNLRPNTGGGEPMLYQISGLSDHRLWFVYATNHDTAQHIASVMHSDGHTEVRITELPEDKMPTERESPFPWRRAPSDY